MKLTFKKDIWFVFLMTITSFLLIGYPLYSNYKIYDYLNDVEILFGASIIVALAIIDDKVKSDNFLFGVFILSVLVSALSKDEPNQIPTVLMMVFFVVVFYHMNLRKYYLFVVSICIAIMPYFLIWVYRYIVTSQYQGNRWTLHLCIIGIMIVSYMNYANVSNKWKYSILTVSILLAFLGGSRTALVACVAAFMLLVIVDFKSKIKLSRFLFSIIAIVIVFFILFKYQDIIFQNVFNKWNGAQKNIFDGRSMMWIDVFSEIKMWGYSSDYIWNKFGLNNSHNSFIEAYTLYGVITGISYLLINLLGVYKVLKQWSDPFFKSISIVFFPFIFISIFESVFFLENEYLFLGICNLIVLGQINQQYRITRLEKTTKSMGIKLCHEEKI